ncbi:MAG: hypothetical protein VX541_14470 [Candidatus Poribacteria bacterium]|nr:hypothetical protein [Candidatus Poribacteria bacterium]
MNIKLVTITLLTLFALFVLIQIQSTASLNPVLYSMATSVRNLVKLVFQPQKEPENQVVTKSQRQFLNPTNETKVAPSTTSETKYKQQLDQTRESVPSSTDINPDLSFNTFEPESAHPTISNENEEIFKILSSIIGSEDPVTDLFPETEWYDAEFDFDNVSSNELWQADWKRGNVPVHEDLERNQVERLLEEFRPEFSNHSGIDQIGTDQIDTLDQN